MMTRRLRLRVEPTVRQTDAILGRVERDLRECGATVERTGGHQLRFRMPLPWAAPHLGALLAIGAGRVMVSAGAGDRRQVRYALSFARLQTAAVLAGAAVLVTGWRAVPPASLLSGALATWGVAYLPLYSLAARRFRHIVANGARDVVERRQAPRASDGAATDTP